ncbi:GntR family transcriptional regulator [Bacillus massiliigorillae]|uniref:GntR family transcriptional regulator n=1 Tax=Bacillus massiliigorillae TaxID=1243664 RepID=UPI0005A8751D|nr:GntR family transcriptional regulator [Bacillus massiliigorillae]
MWIQLNFESETPIYTQLVHAIMEGIATGALQPGDELPAVRSLASDLGVNMLTVNKAYQQLKQLNAIQIHRKKGAIIHPDGVPKADDAYLLHLNTSLRPILVEGICRGLSEKDLLAQIHHVYDEFLKGGNKDDNV